ncbi:hypothetical protein YPPY59_2859, partial [Yersinia pestis PY-59]
MILLTTELHLSLHSTTLSNL